MFTHSVEIGRSPEDVFAYLDQPERHKEWQEQITSTRVESEGPIGVGTRVAESRRIRGREIPSGYEITEHDPPRRSSFRGTEGPIRPVGTVIVEPIGDGSSSRVTLEFELVGRGVAKLFAPIVRRQAYKQIPLDQGKLKQRLESGA